MSQSVSGTSLATTAAATHRTVAYRLYIGWGVTSWPAAWGAQCEDETARLLNVTWSRQLDFEPMGVGRGPMAELTLTLDNRDQRLSPYNTASPIYSKLIGTTTTAGGIAVTYPRLFHVPVRLEMGFFNSTAEAEALWETGSSITYDGTDVLLFESISPEYITVFSGVVEDPGENYGLAGDKVTLRCLDRGAVLANRKTSSEIFTDQRADQWLGYLVDNVCGISDGVLDYSTLTIPYCWLDDESVWTECQQAAGAVGGYFFMDELGVPQFRTATWWATASDSTSSQWTFTVAKFADLSPSYDWRAVATGAIVEYQQRAPGGEQVVWRSDNPIIIPPGEKLVQARLSWPCTSLISPVVDTDWTPVNGGGIPLDAYVTMSLQDRNAQRVTIRFYNNGTQTAFVPTCQVRGRVLVGGPTEEIEKTAAVDFIPNKNVLRYTGNAYIQTKAQADLLGVITLERMQYPRLTYRLSGVRAVPWLQLGDRITIDVASPGITDTTTPFSAARDAIVTGLDFAYAPDQAFLMTVTAIDATATLPYSDYFVIGTNRYNQSGGTGAGRTFV